MNSGTWVCRQMHNFRGNENLRKLSKEYLNDLLCNFGFSLQHSETFDISHDFFTGNRRKVINVQTGPIFWTTL